MPGVFKEQEVMAYAETRLTRSYIAEPSSIEEIAEVLQHARKSGLTICPRGSGYTYGDMILNNAHAILDTRRMDRVLEWDPASGLMRVEPGVRFSEVFALGLPHNRTLSACPGGMWVTIGGAISNNVHGKDSAKCGNFGHQVESVKLMLADGRVRSYSRESEPGVFKAIIGGMGLLGVIVEATIRLRQVPSAYVDTKSVHVRNIEESVDALEAARELDDFSVAWVDAFSSGSSMGRGYVATARWVDDPLVMDKARLDESLRMPTRVFGILPTKPTWFLARPLFGPTGIRMVNIAHYNMARINTGPGKRLLFTEYNFMHNRIPDLKHVYRPEGFLEFQPMIPRAAGASGLRRVLELSKRHGAESLLCGVKTHRKDDYAFSYSGDGYSIGIDIQLRGRRRQDIERFSRELFDLTIELGGRTFLAKDEMLGREQFRRMYPEWEGFMRIKEALDPEGLFQSDMYRRLLRPETGA